VVHARGRFDAAVDRRRERHHSGLLFIKVNEHGRWRLTVTAWGTRMSDAIARKCAWFRTARKARGALESLGRWGDRPCTSADIIVPGTCASRSSSILARASQIVEGLDGLLRMPGGCFEQTSSMLYPDILVLDYLKQTGQLEAKPQLAMQASSTSPQATSGCSLLSERVARRLFALWPAARQPDAHGLWADGVRGHVARLLG